MKNMLVRPTIMHGVSPFTSKINLCSRISFQLGGKSDIHMKIVTIVSFFNSTNLCGDICIGCYETIIKLTAGVKRKCG